MLTDEQLDEIEARANAAQPGPWPMPDEVHDHPKQPGRRDYNDPRRPLDHEGCSSWPWHTEANMEFAYRARDDVPVLVAEVRRLRWFEESIRKQHIGVVRKPVD